MKTELTCIVCPNGCRLQVEQNGTSFQVEGARCKRGIPFAEKELTNPMRSLTTTVATAFSHFPRLPVRTAGEIPKEKLFAAMEQINQILITQPLSVGDVVLEDVFGVPVIATYSIPKKEDLP